MTTDEVRQAVKDLLAASNLALRYEFVPWSKSRNANEKDVGGRPVRSLNWKVTLYVGGKEVMRTDYGAGIASCPSYKQGFMTLAREAVIVKECETGLPCSYQDARNEAIVNRSGKPVLPDDLDVIACLVRDCDVFNYACFEDWAEALGFEPDSRKAEAIYRERLKNALALRCAVGSDALHKFEEACREW